MAKSPEPVVLELASLPREQVGPFLLLGLDKAADKKQMERHWADRVKWARKQQIKVPLEDINWARDVLGDPSTGRSRGRTPSPPRRCPTPAPCATPSSSRRSRRSCRRWRPYSNGWPG